ncbi:hypothetical protein [Cereibacter sphaeroides]|uniref:hypothetical protein n=1 Tax=Cereibacter sphaeroides TaxID=1063 RepID=UPI000F52DD1E|nr:hypothetical protein [Cereibacter sphaeroides]
MVARIVSNPVHIGKKGVKASVIPNAHLREKGLSLVRLGILVKDEFEAIARAISASIPPGDNGFAGVISANAADIRGLLDYQKLPAICLFDDPVPSDGDIPANAAHATALAAESYPEDEIVRIKSELMSSVFGRLTPPDQIEH